jgi:hypothetical protein
LEGVIRGRGVAAIAGLPGVRLTGVAADSSCLCIQKKGNIVMLRLYKNKQKRTLLMRKHVQEVSKVTNK